MWMSLLNIIFNSEIPKCLYTHPSSAVGIKSSLIISPFINGKWKNALCSCYFPLKCFFQMHQYSQWHLRIEFSNMEWEKGIQSGKHITFVCWLLVKDSSDFQGHTIFITEIHYKKLLACVLQQLKQMLFTFIILFAYVYV